MGILSTICAYHPDKSAVAVCQQCRKPICELDVNKAEKGYRYGRQTYDLCLYCYRNYQNKRISMNIIIIIAAFFMILLEILIANYLLVFAMILLIIGGIIRLSHSNTNFNRNFTNNIAGTSTESTNKNILISNQNIPPMHGVEAQNFSSQALDTSIHKKPSLTTRDNTTCKFCGYNLFPEDIFCSNCGNRKN